jgi:nitrogenase-stabilizing/protective protein
MTAAYDFKDETADCEGAEDFFNHFGIVFDGTILQICRLHILQRFHDYVAGTAPESFADYRALLERAYGDFVKSDAQTEKVFRVFKKAAGIATVPLTAIGRGRAAP